MVQLLFTRLPSFTESQRPLLKKLKMRSGTGDKSKRKSKVKPQVYVCILRKLIPICLGKNAKEFRMFFLCQVGYGFESGFSKIRIWIF